MDLSAPSSSRIWALRPQTAHTVVAGVLSVHVRCNLSSIFHQSSHTNSEAPSGSDIGEKHDSGGVGCTRESVFDKVRAGEGWQSDVKNHSC